MKFVSVVLTLSIFVGGSPQKHTQADEDDIHEAVLRYQIDSWYAAEKAETRDKSSTPKEREIENRLKPLIVHISVNGKDPSPQFLARFKDDKRLVRPASEASPKDMGKPSGMPSGKIIFSSDTIKWISSTHVNVEGGYYCGPLCASGQTFYVEKQNGRWKVTGSRMSWIS
jgi:hypothetical protein